MMLDAAGVAHAGSGNDDGGVVIGVDGLGFLARQRVMQIEQFEGIIAFVQERQGVVIEKLPVMPEHFCGADGQRAVHEDGHIRKLAPVIELMQAVEDFLRALHSEGGNDDLAAVAVAVADGIGEFVQTGRGILMIAIAVGGFHEDVVGLGRRLGIPDDEGLRAADVAGENDARCFAVFGYFEPDGRGAEDVPSLVKSGPDARGRFYGLVQIHGSDLLCRALGVQNGVNGFRRVLETAAGVLLGLELSFHLLNVRAVFEHEGDELTRSLCAVDPAGEPVFDEGRKKAGMIDVGVGEEHEVHIFGAVDL